MQPIVRRRVDPRSARLMLPAVQRRVARRSGPILPVGFARLRVVLVGVQRPLEASRAMAQEEVGQAPGVLPALALPGGPRLVALGSGIMIDAPPEGHLPMDRGARLSP